MLPSHRFAAGEVIVKIGKGNVMKKCNLLAILATSVTIVFATTPAYAQATRTWVSGIGNDADPCSRTAPCKTFAGALSKTAAGGEINCLDPGGFGAVTIGKSITIDCTGTLGGLLGSGTTGVIVNGAGIVVTLRGLDINGGTPVSPGTNGVRFLQGARLNIENSTIYNFAAASPNGNGIIVNNTSGTTRLHVSNTVIRNNSTAVSGAGIRVIPTGAAAAHVTLENVEITGNFRGIDVVATGTTGAINVTVGGGAITNNTENAINVATNANAANLMIEGTTIASNGHGIFTNGAGAQARLGNSIVASNGTAFSAAGSSVIRSYKNNQVDFNTDNATPRPQVVFE